MNTDKLNQLLSLFANVAVLIGIIFLVVKLRQANRIALRDSRTEIQLAGIEINNPYLEDSNIAELRYKLQSPTPELSNTELVQARALAENQINFWTLINISAQTELLPEEVEEAYVNLAVSYLEQHPGMIPIFRDIFVANRIQRGEFSLIYDVIIDSLENSPY